jgi:PP-loop superfamily ATP-utilizing enzyme
MNVDPRVDEARAVLAAHGVSGDVSVEGHEREMAAIRVSADDWARLMGDEGARVAAEVKAAGFRYVALDLAAEDDDDPPVDG